MARSRSGRPRPGVIGRKLYIESKTWILLGLVAGTAVHTGRGAYIRRAIRDQLRRDGIIEPAEAWISPRP
jgi:hypothetical protein